jgi:hypothetical protein
MQADLKQRNERFVQLRKRVFLEWNERLNRLSQTTPALLNSFLFKGTERRISPLAIGGKAHQHAEGVVRRHLDIRREMELPQVAGMISYVVVMPLPPTCLMRF